jgi:hypothetical protein
MVRGEPMSISKASRVTKKLPCALAAAVILVGLGCATPLIHNTDLPTIAQNVEEFKGERVRFSAPVMFWCRYDEHCRGFRTWYAILEKDDVKIRCYENSWKLHTDPIAEYMMRAAQQEKGEVRVTGDLYVRKRNQIPLGLELHKMEYKGITLQTDSVIIGEHF